MTMIDKEMLLQRINTQFWSEIENIIISAPSIDIVRCGECKMWMSEHLCQWWSRYGTVETDADDFCSYGERENDE